MDRARKPRIPPSSFRPISGCRRESPMTAHESCSRPDAVRRSSNRTFGLVFAAFFLVVAILPLLRGHAWRWWALPCGAVFLIAAILAPKVLSPLNQAWTAIGIALHKITSPIILGILFYLVFAPFG